MIDIPWWGWVIVAFVALEISVMIVVLVLFARDTIRYGRVVKAYLREGEARRRRMGMHGRGRGGRKG